MVRPLIDSGADTNIDGDHGLPICYVRDKRLAQLLIAHGADINRWSNGDGAPLFFSVWNADPQRLKLQLELGADPNRRDPRTVSRHYTSLA